jgi:hypothetical protein
VTCVRPAPQLAQGHSRPPVLLSLLLSVAVPQGVRQPGSAGAVAGSGSGAGAGRLVHGVVGDGAGVVEVTAGRDDPLAAVLEGDHLPNPLIVAGLVGLQAALPLLGLLGLSGRYLGSVGLPVGGLLPFPGGAASRAASPRHPKGGPAELPVGELGPAVVAGDEDDLGPDIAMHVAGMAAQQPADEVGRNLRVIPVEGAGQVAEDTGVVADLDGDPVEGPAASSAAWAATSSAAASRA